MVLKDGNKKAQGHATAHLKAGIAKHHRRNELETTNPTPNMLEHSGVEAVCIRNIPGALPRHPSLDIEFGDFDIKDESAERSLGRCGCHPATSFFAESSTRRCKVTHYFRNGKGWLYFFYLKEKIKERKEVSPETPRAASTDAACCIGLRRTRHRQAHSAAFILSDTTKKN